MWKVLENFLFQMQGVLERIHGVGCKYASIWTPKMEMVVGDSDFKFDSGEFCSVQRLFKSKAPAVRIEANNHVVSERKAGKLPIIFASCPSFGTNAVMIDCRSYIIVAVYDCNKTDKEKREIHEAMEQIGQDVMNKKF
jgi:hypothetical protein